MKMIKDLGQLRRNENSNYTKRFGIFECPYCNKPFKAVVSEVKSGHTKACGCVSFVYDRIIKRHGESGTRLYGIYYLMLNRCYNKNNVVFNNYGGRGISVCDEWKNDFMTFYNWAMVNGYSDNLEIDRIDNEGNYCPENCRWVTRSENMQNTRLLISTNKSGYRGVYYKKNRKRWVSTIRNKNKRTEIGSYKTKELAAQAYNDFVIKNKTFHPLNIIR
jgi:hypothetical protein